jgi:hypothetical protein
MSFEHLKVDLLRDPSINLFSTAGPAEARGPKLLLKCGCGSTRFAERTSFEIELPTNSYALMELTTQGNTTREVCKAGLLRYVFCDECGDDAVLTKQEAE